MITVAFVFQLLSVTCVLTSQVSPWEDDARKLFEQFKVKYGKTYARSYDNEKRFRIFQTNLRQAEQLQRTELETARYGVTPFSDLTDEEFHNMFTTAMTDLNVTMQQLSDRRTVGSSGGGRGVTGSFDWRDKGVITPVKNQGRCDSCYAFAVAANVESSWAIRTGKLVNLSEQQIVDCGPNKGCDEGNTERTFQYIIQSGGLMPQADYAYEAVKKTCKFERSLAVATVDDFYPLSKNENEQAEYLRTNGPFTISFNSHYLQHYTGGVIDQATCPGKIDHSCLTVGYGVEQGPGSTDLPYWIVKNSWGAWWGEQGYFRIARGKNLCNVADYAVGSSPSMLSPKSYVVILPILVLFRLFSSGL